MFIIIKYVLRNIREKKLRTFLILTAVALSTALFFASTAISDTVEEMYLQRMKKYFGDADLVIHSQEGSPSAFFHTEQAEPYRRYFEYMVGSLEATAYFSRNNETVRFSLKGFDWQELQLLNPVLLVADSGLLPFQGRKIVVSQRFAQAQNVKAGDTIELEINNTRQRFRVTGIAGPAGPFQDDGQAEETAVIPLEMISSFYNARGRVSLLYIKLRDSDLIQPMLQELTNTYRRYQVREPFSRQEFREYASTIITPFLMMLTLVVFISIFIIYTSFKVITTERLPVIGVFRSIGATQKTTGRILRAESLMYGVIGGTLGCGLGFVILSVMSRLLFSPSLQGLDFSLRFSYWQPVAAFLLAIFLCLAGAALPVKRIARFSIREIILESYEEKRKKSRLRPLLGLAFLLFSLLAPFYLLDSIPLGPGLIIAAGCMLLSVFALVMLIPTITSVLLKLFERFFLLLFGNEGSLAAKNLRENKSVLNNISLLTIGISSMLMISTLSFSMGLEVTNAYRDFNFDIWLWSWQADRFLEQRLRSIEGVADTYGIYSVYNLELADRQDRISMVQGVNPYKHTNFMEVYILEGDTAEVLKELDTGRYIIMTAVHKERFGLEKGDTVTLRTSRGPKDYVILNFMNSLMNNGSHALVAERFLKADMDLQYYGDIFLKTNRDPFVVAAEIRKRLLRNSPWVRTVREMEAENLEANEQIFLLLQGFSLMALVIGIFGVLNNLLISFIERRRSLAVLRSLGMSKYQTVKMVFVESLTGGAVGGFAGVLGGVLLISIMPQVLKVLLVPFPLSYSPVLLVMAFFAGVAITMVASTGPAFKSSRLNVIEAIKYE